MMVIKIMVIILILTILVVMIAMMMTITLIATVAGEELHGRRRHQGDLDLGQAVRCWGLIFLFLLEIAKYSKFKKSGERLRGGSLQAVEHQRLVLGFNSCQGIVWVIIDIFTSTSNIIITIIASIIGVTNVSIMTLMIILIILDASNQPSHWSEPWRREGEFRLSWSQVQQSPASLSSKPS